MRINRCAGALLTLLCLAASALPAAADVPLQSQAGTARVWFLRPSGMASGGAGADPLVFANGTPICRLTAGTMFFRDFPAGTYSFAVQPYGLPSGQTETLQLPPSAQVYLQVSRVGSWEVGQAEGTFSAAPNTFAIMTMAPQLAQAYLPTLTYTGAR